MHSYRGLISRTFCLASLTLCVVGAGSAVTITRKEKVDTRRARVRFVSSTSAGTGRVEAASVSFKWNLTQAGLPLLGLPNAHLTAGLDQSLSYPLGQFSFPIFQTLRYDDEHSRYFLPSLSSAGTDVHFIEFAPGDARNTFNSTDGANLKLIDNDSMKVVRTSDGTKYIFVRYPDGEFRCTTIKDPNGASLNLLYTANGLVLHGVVDSAGRTVTFNYTSDGIKSVTQTWMANSEGLTKTWLVGDQPESNPDVRYSHSVSAFSKKLPSNAVVRQYSAAMATSDQQLARIFGGPGAVAGANGFEPAGLAAAYPFYRGNIIGDDGIERRGHLSYAMHLYGSADGTGDSSLYVPAGFTQHSGPPSPTDAAITFYYPRLGNLTDVTLAVFHVADFHLSYEGERVRIGSIGGPGGSSASYKHSHIEFYRGNTGLPSLSARPGLRIDPTTIFTAPANTPEK